MRSPRSTSTPGTGPAAADVANAADAAALVALVARAAQCRVARVPAFIGDEPIGSVAAEQVPALLALAPDAASHLQLDASGLRLIGPEAGRDAWLGQTHARLRDAGFIRAWRNETYAVVGCRTLAPLARIERAAARFWGTLTVGAHATGYTRDAHGRVARLWIAQRSFQKATDPGLYDNLVGGGVPFGQTPHGALLREAWEEAGLDAAIAAQAQPACTLRLHCDIREGLQHEWLYAWELALPPEQRPANQDGEVAAFSLMTPGEVLPLIAAGHMTLDASLVTLEFLLRQGLLPPGLAAALAAPLAEAAVPQAQADRLALVVGGH